MEDFSETYQGTGMSARRAASGGGDQRPRWDPIGMRTGVLPVYEPDQIREVADGRKSLGMKRALLVGLTIVAAVACGVATNGTSTKPSAASSTAPSAAAAKPPTTDQLTALLRKANLPINGITVYTADTDANHLLGRPNQYIAKVSWHDTRVTQPPSDPNSIAVSDGGGVEIFATSADLTSRQAYIKAVAKSPLFAEYDFPIGQFTLLRISNVLTPDAAQQYVTALASFA